jgi:cytidylate kinase
MSIVIAIDGPAAAGKGTLGLRLEQHFKLAKLDTGLLYRATGFKVLSQGGDPEDPAQAEAAARALDPAELNNPQLRTDESAQAASKVSAIPGVRAALLDFQRNFAQNPPKLADGSTAQGAILDGRDIGTTVCPDAQVKLFVTASPEIRAKRRFKELRDRGLEAIYARVLDDMKERDARDTSRSASPLVAAADALHLDTSDMDADQAFAAALDFIAAKNLF